MSLIICDKISLSYDGRSVIKNLTFSIESGEYISVVGENGSGKSTLIKAILGLKTPSSGKIIYGDGLKSREIGYLPQKSELQRDFPASVYETVISGRLSSHPILPFYSKDDKSIAEENMKKLGILEIKNRSFSELSGGQQQRVLLARALCATKKLILLDEPMTGLDPDASEELYAIIKKINSEGITVIMVTHDLIPAVKAATRVLHLGKGGSEFYLPREFIEELARKGGHTCG